MASNVPSVTLALTLPISCHICLGKVRQPVICVNHHVFCSSCIECWLKNNNQCPACRVTITAENPCKDIIGGTSEENESIRSPSVRKHLRKTRLEILHKEYEDEIESLVREAEELRRTNVTLEERLNRVADPITDSSSCDCGNRQAEDKSSVCNKLLEAWNRKLQEVNAANKKVTGDIDKLKEENRRLKNENDGFVRENLRLRSEVDLRSPQKFGRYTVAALQAKVDQYEREMSRLKKALERSDQYIEELQAQIVQLKRPPEDKQIEKSQCGNTAHMEEQAATSYVCKDNTAAKLFPTHSFDNGFHSKDFKGLCPSSTTVTQTPPKLENGLHKMWNGKELASLGKERPSKGMDSPSSSLPFSSLQLNTPDGKTNSFSNTNVKKPLTHLRKLVFDAWPRRRELGKSALAGNEHNVNNADGTTQPGQPDAEGDAVDSISRTLATIREDFSNPGTSNENSEDINLNCNDDPTNAMSHLKNQKNPSASCLTPDWVKHFQMESPIHLNKSSEDTEMLYHGSSEQTDSSGMCNSLPSLAAYGEAQGPLFMAQPSTDRHNRDFNNQSSLPLQPEEEVRPWTESNEIFFPGHRPTCSDISSPLNANYTGSPPAKRQLLDPCKNSPSKCSKK